MNRINKKALRRLLLDIASKRHHKFTQVAIDEVAAKAECALTIWAMNYVQSLPSKGKTIR